MIAIPTIILFPTISKQQVEREHWNGNQKQTPGGELHKDDVNDPE